MTKARLTASKMDPVLMLLRLLVMKAHHIFMAPVTIKPEQLTSEDFKLIPKQFGLRKNSDRSSVV